MVSKRDFWTKQRTSKKAAIQNPAMACQNILSVPFLRIASSSSELAVAKSHCVLLLRPFFHAVFVVQHGMANVHREVVFQTLRLGFHDLINVNRVWWIKERGDDMAFVNAPCFLTLPMVFYETI